MVDETPIWDIIAGRIGYCTLIVAHELNVFEHLEDSPKSLSRLSKNLGLEERPVEALMLMLVNLKLVNLNDSSYELSECSREYLLKSSECYFGGMLELSNKNNWTCENLKESVKLNRPQVYSGEKVFESHKNASSRAEKFTKAMHSASMAPALKWPDLIDLSQCETFLDIGCGSGAHTIGVLKRWTHLKAILLDLPSVIEISKEFLSNYNFAEQLDYISDDLWSCSFPVADVHFYSQIFHDWPEDKCKTLASKSFASLPNNGKILIHEILFNENKHGPVMASAGNVGMLAWTEGKQYSGNEIEDILLNSGFSSVNVVPTFGYWSLVVGVK